MAKSALVMERAIVSERLDTMMTANANAISIQRLTAFSVSASWA